MQEFDIGSEQIDALYHYAKFQFECGNYSTASEFLYHYRTLSTDPERNMSALWGKLAATILQQVSHHRHSRFMFSACHYDGFKASGCRIHMKEDSASGTPSFVRCLCVSMRLTSRSETSVSCMS